MSDWTKRDQARVEFLNAAVEQWRASDAQKSDATAAAWGKTKAAWEKYRDLIDGNAENGELDKDRWYCPHCGAERPAWNFHFVGVVVMGIGAVQYFNVYCEREECRKLITVMLAGFVPEVQLIAEAKAQMRRKIPGDA